MRTKEYFLGRLLAFQGQTKAEVVSIHLHTQGLSASPFGYQAPGVQYEPPTGLRSFPSVFSCPTAMVATNHLVTIVTVMAENDTTLRY